MAKNMCAPIRMESEFVDSKLHTVLYQVDGADAPIEDGALVVLGDFASDPVYSAAYTSASGAATTIIDINTRYATAPTAATATDVCVIDLPNVPTFANGDEVIRMGVNVIGLTSEAGHWARARKLVKDDTFHIGEGNIEGGGALVVGQFAIPTAGKTTWTPAAAAPESGFYAKVVKKETKGIGIANSFVQYMLCVMAN